MSRSSAGLGAAVAVSEGGDAGALAAAVADPFASLEEPHPSPAMSDAARTKARRIDMAATLTTHADRVKVFAEAPRREPRQGTSSSVRPGSRKRTSEVRDPLTQPRVSAVRRPLNTNPRNPKAP